jgi:hypothetical protein
MPDGDDAVPRWDTDLAPEEARRLPPAHKGKRALLSLTRKVELLELWGKEGLPPEMKSSVPWDRAKLRRWKDVGLRLWSWADPQVDGEEGRNSDLIGRFYAALKVIEVRRKDKGLNLTKQVQAKDRIIANLQLQVATLVDQNRQLQMMVGIQPLTRR